MYIIDSHCHIHMIKKNNLKTIINRASENKIILHVLSTNLEEITLLKKLTEFYNNIFLSVGIHPNKINNNTYLDEEKLLSLATKERKIIGIGEAGLDYFKKDKTHIKKQKKVFVTQINISQRSNNLLPISIHTRYAENDTIDILNSKQKQNEFQGLIHCFTGSKTFAKKILDLGMYISISGIITFKNAEHIRDVVKYIPLQKILIETDTPYLSPVPHRGKENEPSYIKYTLEILAAIKSTTSAKITFITTSNFLKLFKKSKIINPSYYQKI